MFLGPFGGEGGYDPKRPAVTSTLWYEPARILGETHPRRPEGMYLADLVVTSASLVNGILGIHPTWDKLDVEPCLPSGWDSATATVIYKGVRHTVAIRNGQATVTPSQGRIYLLFEGGPRGCHEAVQVVSFNLSWLLNGRDITTLVGKTR